VDVDTPAVDQILLTGSTTTWALWLDSVDLLWV